MTERTTMGRSKEVRLFGANSGANRSRLDQTNRRKLKRKWLSLILLPRTWRRLCRLPIRRPSRIRQPPIQTRTAIRCESRFKPLTQTSASFGLRRNQTRRHVNEHHTGDDNANQNDQADCNYRVRAFASLNNFRTTKPNSEQAI